MKTLSKTLTVLIPILFISSISFAQQRDRGMAMNRMGEQMQDIPAEVKAEAHVAVLNKYLKLDEAQKTKIKKIDLDHAEKTANIRSQKIAPRKKMPLMQELQQEHQKEVHAVLTKEQYASYLENKEAIRYDIRQKLMEYSKSKN